MDTQNSLWKMWLMKFGEVPNKEDEKVEEKDTIEDVEEKDTIEDEVMTE